VNLFLAVFCAEKNNHEGTQKKSHDYEVEKGEQRGE
jgi:hypothetical protein